MKKVILLFPDHLSIADFILSMKLRNSEVNSEELTLTATLTETDVEVAQEMYKAVLKAET